MEENKICLNLPNLNLLRWRVQHRATNVARNGEKDFDRSDDPHVEEYYEYVRKRLSGREIGFEKGR